MKRSTRMVLSGASTTLALTSMAALGGASAAWAASYHTSGSWLMNEKAGSTVMVDSSGRGLNGSIGSLVQTGKSYGGDTGYLFSGGETANLGRLVQVHNASALNAGSTSTQLRWTVKVAMRSWTSEGNILQKGQAGTSGGFYKVEQTNGQFGCNYTDTAGFQREAWSAKSYKDTAVHTVVCEKRPDRVTVTVDGVTTTKWAGTDSAGKQRILKGQSNSYPLVIGGKSSCNGTTVDCDYFNGYVLSAKVETFS